MAQPKEPTTAQSLVNWVFHQHLVIQTIQSGAAGGLYPTDVAEQAIEQIDQLNEQIDELLVNAVRREGADK